MPTDRDILLKHRIDGWDIDTLIDHYGQPRQTIVGRLSRAAADPALAIEIVRLLSEKTTGYSGVISLQKDIVHRSLADFEGFKQQLVQQDKEVTGLFMSDLHLPYTRWDALQLTLKIIADLQPEYVSAFNDGFDMTGFTRWPDTRSASARLWEEDIDNAVQAYGALIQAIKRVAPQTKLPQVIGNHDLWMYNYLRSNRSGFTERDILWFMERVEEMGVWQFTNGEAGRQNLVPLSPGLTWTHGFSAAARISGVGDVNLEKAASDGVYVNVVSGHTHRSGEHLSRGVRFWNSGKLCWDDMPYMKAPPRWQTGIVINRFMPGTREVYGTVVDFTERKGHLIARYGSAIYDVPLDNTTPYFGR